MFDVLKGLRDVSKELQMAAQQTTQTVQGTGPIMASPAYTPLDCTNQTRVEEAWRQLEAARGLQINKSLTDFIQKGAQPKPSAHDAVHHPKHYTSHPSGVECIQITEHMSFNLGNVVKYLWRADEKGAPIEDLKKALWYLNREIEKREKR